MANKKNAKNKTKTENNAIKNSIIKKILIALGVIILCFGIIYSMNYFFVEKNHIKINMSTDKKVEFININGEDTLITTQKYVSDLNYSMRYDVNNFRVFKYHNQDFYKYKDGEKVIIIVEKSKVPKGCTNENNEKDYNKCTLEVDDYTEENYISFNNLTYKLTVKNPNSAEYENKIKTKVDYMLKSFEINI